MIQLLLLQPVIPVCQNNKMVKEKISLSHQLDGKLKEVGSYKIPVSSYLHIYHKGPWEYDRKRKEIRKKMLINEREHYIL